MQEETVRRSDRIRKRVNYKGLDVDPELPEPEDDDVTIDSESGVSSSDLFFDKKTSKKKRIAEVEDIITKTFNEDNIYEESNEYIKEREENRNNRLAILKTLEVDSDLVNLKTIKSEYSPFSSANKIQKNKTPRSKIKKENQVVLRKRCSLRLQQKLFTEIPGDTTESFVSENNDSEPEYRNEEQNYEIDINEEDLKIFENLENDLNIKYESITDFTTCDIDKFIEIIKTFRLWKSPTKIIPLRISALNIHSSTEKLFVIAGDKAGNISLWDLKKDIGLSFHGHDRQVNCVSFSHQNNTSFFTTSLDGTVRKGNFNSKILELIYKTPSLNERTTWHCELNNSLMVSESTGIVKLLDFRAPDSNRSEFSCHNRSCRTVQIHPTNDNYFLTSSGFDAEFAVHDIRTNSKKLQPVLVQKFKKGLTSAFYSYKGNYVVTTCNDDTIRVYNFTSIDSCDEITKTAHDNHTGRWLSVFKAIWQPQREDCFYIGSLMKPRRVQLYRSSGRLIREFQSDELATVCSLIAVHPSQPLFVAGNNSGKIHVFTPYRDLLEI